VCGAVNIYVTQRTNDAIAFDGIEEILNIYLAEVCVGTMRMQGRHVAALP